MLTNSKQITSYKQQEQTITHNNHNNHNNSNQVSKPQSSNNKQPKQQQSKPTPSESQLTQ